MNTARFADRHEAGLALAARLQVLRLEAPLVLALPRGGVPVGWEVARALRAPLDVLLVRKIGSAANPEFGIGAIAEGLTPEVTLDQRALNAATAPPGHIEAETQRQLAELERRRERYRRGRRLPSLLHREVIVVDDGIATGGTMRAALKAVARAGARRIVLAVPVAPVDTLAELKGEADTLLCLRTPDPFYAVGDHYVDFEQLSDGEVVRLLDDAREPTTSPPARPPTSHHRRPRA